MEITYDKIADALYIYFRKAKVFKTLRMNDRMLVDVGAKGKIIGVEILDASSQIPREKLIGGTFDILSTVK